MCRLLSGGPALNRCGVTAFFASGVTVADYFLSVLNFGNIAKILNWCSMFWLILAVFRHFCLIFVIARGGRTECAPTVVDYYIM